MRKTTTAMMLKKTQAPTVPPMMAPRLVFEPFEDTEVVSVDVGVTKTVVVPGLIAAGDTELCSICQDLCTVEVKPLLVQPF